MINWFFRVDKSDFGFRAILISLAIWYLGLIFIGIPIADSLNARTGIIGFILVIIFPIVLAYAANKSLYKFRDIVDEQDKVKRKELISSTDMPALCLDMLEAVQQKYRYTNYETKLENYSDWIAFQVKHNRKEMMENLFHPQQEKDLTREFMVTYDNVLIASNKFLGWLLHTNYLVIQFFSAGSFIEINLVSKVLQDDVFDNIQLRIKFGTKAMSLRGKGELAEIRFALDEKDKPRYEEIIMMQMPFFSFVEKEMEDSDTVEFINFMQKFVKKTRRLVR